MTHDMLISLTSDKILNLGYYDEIIVKSYTESNGRLRVVYNNVVNGIYTNMDIEVTATLDDGRIENLRGFKTSVNNYEKIVEKINDVDLTNYITEAAARESIGSQNVIIGEGKLYYRYNYGKNDIMLWKSEVLTGSKRLIVYVDALTGEEVDIALKEHFYSSGIVFKYCNYCEIIDKLVIST